jgi:hypothetical protein
MYGFHNKLECLSLNTRLCWKVLPGTETVNYGRNKFYDTGPWGQWYKTFYGCNVHFLCNNLECLSLKSLSRIAYCLQIMQEPIQAKHFSDAPP